MTILSLDASTSCTGWAVFDNRGLASYGCIKPVGDDWRARIEDQAPRLRGIIEQYHPDEIIMEDVPLKESGGLKTLVTLGAVQGSILTIAGECGISIRFLLPNEWRSKFNFYDGTREGTKRDVLKQKAVEYVNSEFGLNLLWKSPSSKFNQDDIAEAICIGYSTIKKRKFGRNK